LELGPIRGDHNCEAFPADGSPPEPFSSLVLTREGRNPPVWVRKKALLGYPPPYLFADRLLFHRAVHNYMFSCFLATFRAPVDKDKGFCVKLYGNR